MGEPFFESEERLVLIYVQKKLKTCAYKNHRFFVIFSAFL